MDEPTCAECRHEFVLYERVYAITMFTLASTGPSKEIKKVCKGCCESLSGDD